MINIKKGCTLPLAGAPEQVVHAAPPIAEVGVMLADYPGLAPQLLVRDGERVRTGQALFCDATFPQICVAAPATGRVQVIRDAAPDAGNVRALSIAIEIDEHVEYPRVAADELPALTDAQVRSRLLDAGMWPAFRTRPFNRTPRPDVVPHAIFVTAIDTQPHAPRAEVLIEADLATFGHGLTVISQLTSGLVYVCKAPAAYVPVPDIINIKVEEFAGPHPAGLTGTHIHYLDRVGRDADKQVWSINYQEVMAIGRLFVGGRVDPERVIALAGSQVVDARLLRVRMGANLLELTAGQLKTGQLKIAQLNTESSCLISGSVLQGRGVSAEQPFLGRHHLQVSAMPVAAVKPYPWWGWGTRQFSVLPIFLARLLRIKRFRLATAPAVIAQPPLLTAAFARIWPLRLPVLPLLQALLDQDVQRALACGALELAEEDLALCSLVCPGKQNYGELLRKILDEVAHDAQREH